MSSQQTEPFSRMNMYNEIIKRFGTVQRTRGCYLYTKKGIRITDMFQENGKAVLGWKHGRAQLAFKNTLEKGLTGFLPTECESGLVRAVHAIVPPLFKTGQVFWFTRDDDTVDNILDGSFESCRNKDKIQNLNSFTKETWRPWYSSTDLQTESICVLKITAPFPWAQNVIITVIAPFLSLDLKSDLLAPPLSAAFSRAFYDLAAEIPNRHDEDFTCFNKTLSPYFKRNGCWFFPVANEKNYNSFFNHCLDCHILVSPYYNQPSVFPWGASKGDFTLLRNNPFVLDNINNGEF